MADKFVMSVRQADELDHAFERNGWTPEDVKRLSMGTILADVKSVLLGNAEIKGVEHLIDLDADPIVGDGWKVGKHETGGSFKWDPKEVLLYLSEPQRKGDYINGIQVHHELLGKPVLNANTLDYLFEHPHLIPTAWKKKTNGQTTRIYFWGTIYNRSDCAHCVRCLYWDGGRWRRSFKLVDDYASWKSNMPAALRKAARTPES